MKIAIQRYFLFFRIRLRRKYRMDAPVQAGVTYWEGTALNNANAKVKNRQTRYIVLKFSVFNSRRIFCQLMILAVRKAEMANVKFTVSR